MRVGPLPLLAAACLWAVGASNDEPFLLLGGACDGKGFLNTMLFQRQGTTASGAPYYKAWEAEQYIYYDPDCAGIGGVAPRWIISQDRPSTSRVKDLDGDNGCNYHARYDSVDSSHPPPHANWHMYCNGLWLDRQVMLMEITTTSTVTGTSTTSTTTSTTVTGTVTTSTTSTTSTTTSITTVTHTVTTTSSTTTSVSTSSTTTTSVSTSTTTTHTTTTASTTSTTTSSTTVTSSGTSTTRTSTQTGTTTSVTATSITATATSTTGTVTVTTATLTTSTHTRVTSTLTTVQPLASAPSSTTSTSRPADTSTSGDKDPVNATACCDCCDGLNETATCCDEGDGPCCGASEGDDSEQDKSTRASTTTSTTVGPTTTTYTTTLERTLVLSGACAEKGRLNGLVFVRQGVTASGAPFFKARGEDFYIYHDSDCSGVVGAARWIIDSDAPSLTKSSDLDGDADCTYLARLNSDDTSGPPASADWRMFCGQAWQTVPLALQEGLGAGGNPSVVSTGSPAGTTTAPPSTSLAQQDKPVTSDAFELEGACDLQNYLNGPFLLQGKTASGAPFFKMAGKEYYVYFDPDCNGGGDGVARWILDSDRPEASRPHDLDGDGDCKYLARADSAAASGPPGSHSWLMYCHSGSNRSAWEELRLTLRQVNASNITWDDEESALVSAAVRPCRIRAVGALLLAAASAIAVR